MSIEFQRDGTALFISDDGQNLQQIEVSDKTPAQITADYATFQATWSLSWWQNYVQRQLDALLTVNLDFPGLVRAGSLTSVTGANIGTFLSTVCNNYRTLRASIAAATTVSQVQAININSGWPNNP
jgi:hypothetical protein